MKLFPIKLDLLMVELSGQFTRLIEMKLHAKIPLLPKKLQILKNIRMNLQKVILQKVNVRDIIVRVRKVALLNLKNARDIMNDVANVTVAHIITTNIVITNITKNLAKSSNTNSAKRSKRFAQAPLEPATDIIQRKMLKPQPDILLSCFSVPNNRF